VPAGGSGGGGSADPRASRTAIRQTTLSFVLMHSVMVHRLPRCRQGEGKPHTGLASPLDHSPAHLEQRYLQSDHNWCSPLARLVKRCAGGIVAGMSMQQQEGCRLAPRAARTTSARCCIVCCTAQPRSLRSDGCHLPARAGGALLVTQQSSRLYSTV